MLLRCSLAAIMWVFLVDNTIAQQRSNDVAISLGHGMLPIPVLFYHLVPHGGSGGDFVENSSGSSFAAARYAISDRFSVGLGYGYLHFTNLSITNYGNTKRSTGRTFHTIAASCSRRWINKRHFSVFSLFDGGICYLWSSSKPAVRSTFNMQLSPVGISFGGRLAGNIELGIGYKGLINGSLSYTFRQKKISEPHGNESAGSL